MVCFNSTDGLQAQIPCAPATKGLISVWILTSVLFCHSATFYLQFILSLCRMFPIEFMFHSYFQNVNLHQLCIRTSSSESSFQIMNLWGSVVWSLLWFSSWWGSSSLSVSAKLSAYYSCETWIWWKCSIFIAFLTKTLYTAWHQMDTYT